MIEIQCPACQKVQPEAELMLGDAMKQRCNYCGALFEVNVTKSAFLGTEKLSGKIVSKGLLDMQSEDLLAFKIEPKVRALFAFLMFFVGAAILVASHGTLQTHMLVFLAVVCVAAGVFGGMLAGRLGYSEILTSGGAGFLAGIALAALFSILARGGEGGADMKTILQSAFPIFGVYSVGSFAGGTVAWILRRFFHIKLGDPQK